MLVTLFGITTFPAGVPSIRIPLTITRGFFSCCALSHGVPENANSSMLVTLFGIVMLVRLLQL